MSNLIRFEDSLSIYLKSIYHISERKFDSALDLLSDFNQITNTKDDVLYTYLFCGYLRSLIKKHLLAINDFSMVIELSIKSENNLFLLSLAFQGRSEAKYKTNDFRGAFYDLLKSQKYLKLYENKFNETIQSVLNRCLLFDLQLQLNSLENLRFHLLSRINESIVSKYDLITDYKKRLDKQKRLDIYNKLKKSSEIFFSKGDYKRSIKALRRAIRYL